MLFTKELILSLDCGVRQRQDPLVAEGKDRIALEGKTQQDMEILLE